MQAPTTQGQSEESMSACMQVVTGVLAGVGSTRLAASMFTATRDVNDSSQQQCHNAKGTLLAASQQPG